jgi:hypothetical protein
MAADPRKCWPHVPDKANLVKDPSGCEYVLMHCARCNCDVVMKLDEERNIVEQWIMPVAA